MRNLINRWLSPESGRGLWLGRVKLLLTVVLAAVLAQGCTQILDDDLGGGGDLGGGVVVPVAPTGPMAVDIRVVSDPQGGSYISELSCAFEVTEIPGMGSNPIVITVNWLAPCGAHGSEAFVFDGGRQVFESTYSENGRYIGLTFWATISWKDAQGTHQIQSDFAACS